MPFTPSHAVVALPFLRGPLVPGVVAVGAMAPDLPLYVRFSPLTYAHTHSYAWMPATVLLALGLLLVWRCLLRPAARDLVPRAIAVRLPPGWDAGAVAGARETFARRGRTRPSTAGTLLLLLALAIGVATHIGWDSFSHYGRAGVLAVPALDETWGPLPGYQWVQYGSSVLGLVVLAVWALRWLRRTGTRPVAQSVLPGWGRVAWWLSLPLVLVLAWAIAVPIYGPFSPDHSARHLAYRLLPAAAAGWAAASLVLCVAVQALRARAARRPSA